MMETLRKKCLSRGLVSLLAIVVVALFLLLPFLFWTVLFSLWNGWATAAGWSVIIPISWRSVLTAVALCWLLRWLVCRKSS